MGNIVMREQWVNRTESCRLGDSGWYESYTDNEGELFKSLQKEYGRCISKVYIDQVNEPLNPLHVGWVFLKKEEYEDVRGQYFLRETWIDLKHRYKKGD
jgi:hypothetical protein